MTATNLRTGRVNVGKRGTIKTLLRLTGRENLGSEWRKEFKEDLTEGTNPVSSSAHNVSLQFD